MIELFPEWLHVLLGLPHLVWKVVQNHLNLCHIIGPIPSAQHYLHQLDEHIVTALFRDGVRHKYVKGLICVEQVLSQHIYHTDFKVVVQLNVDSHYIVERFA